MLSAWLKRCDDAYPSFLRCKNYLRLIRKIDGKHRFVLFGELSLLFAPLLLTSSTTNKGDLLMTIQTETAPKNLPTHDVLIDIYRAGFSKPKRHKISVGWENKDGKGINIIINGTCYVIRENKTKSENASLNHPTHSVYLIGYEKWLDESVWHRIGPGWIQDDLNEIVIIINGTYYIIRKRKH